MQFHENKCLNHYFLKRAVQPKLQEKMAWSAGIGCPAPDHDEHACINKGLPSPSFTKLWWGAFQLVWGYPAQRNTADLKKNYLVQQSSGMHSLHALGCPAPSQSLQWIRGCPAQTWWHTKLLLFFATFSASLVGNQWQSSLPGGPVPWLFSHLLYQASSLYCQLL